MNYQTGVRPYNGPILASCPKIGTQQGGSKLSKKEQYEQPKTLADIDNQAWSFFSSLSKNRKSLFPYRNNPLSL